MTRPFARYTALRLLAFVASYGLLLLVGLRGLVAIAAALLISSLLSLSLLRRQRDEVAAALATRRGDRDAEQARLRSMLDDGPSRDDDGSGGAVGPPDGPPRG